MGNDGGSIPKRRELVKEAAKALNTTQLKEVQTEQQAHAWSTDPLTRKPLARPVVSDSAGTLYNKDSVIEYLLLPEDEARKAEMEKVLGGRVKGLKDVVEVKFEIDAGGESALVESGGSTGRREKWVCGITGKELGPGTKAVYLVPCGHAFAGSVVKEVLGEVCLQCNEPYAENDVIPILPTLPTDIARLSLRTKTLKEKGLTHALKKAPGSKKRKKNAVEKEETNGNGTTHSSSMPKPKEKDTSSEEEKRNKEKTKSAPSTNGGASNGIKNASTASLTKKVLEEQDERNKRRKLEQNANVKSLFSSRDAGPRAGNSADYMTRGFSIGKR
ncbi:Rtf2 RING-finger-domain-containing protein [Dendryphion nanum]|uniref:Rtf2 RING-finger-domain-containing protein n=1 Tax=Dendryphion nanum TaxID=256645 RepID=A0A9P9J0M6_9PLEO|nr:Rtf2 RING-finger-domain-containing protein [Dendryphion nanum]